MIISAKIRTYAGKAIYKIDEKTQKSQRPTTSTKIISCATDRYCQTFNIMTEKEAEGKELEKGHGPKSI